ncbi:unnamed protein product, partial [Closterium sp. NIES-54]
RVPKHREHGCQQLRPPLLHLPLPLRILLSLSPALLTFLLPFLALSPLPLLLPIPPCV